MAVIEGVALCPDDLEMLDFLCRAHHYRCRITGFKKAHLFASVFRLEAAGLVKEFTPRSHAIAEWLARREAATSGQVPETEPAKPAEPEPVEEAGGDSAREESPPPFVDEPAVPAQPSGAQLVAEIDDYLAQTGMSAGRFSWLVFNGPGYLPQLRKMKRPTATTVEKVRSFIADPPADAMTRRVYPNNWKRIKAKRAKENPEGACGTARKAPAAASSGAAKRVKDSAPTEGAGVDIKINTPPPPKPTGANSPAGKRQRKAAEKWLDAGKSPDLIKNVSLRIVARQIAREREETARLGDKVEQAKTVIRRLTRFNVFNAEVTLGDAGKGLIIVGQKPMTHAEVVAYAERLASARVPA